MDLTRRQEIERLRFLEMNQIEKSLYSIGFSNIAGIDEAGRGPLAGPVYAAAVILDPKIQILGLNDSKKLSVKRREQLAEEIKDKAIAYSIYRVDNTQIDEINILQATKLAMKMALENLGVPADYVLIDSVELDGLENSDSLVKGDTKSNSIAAASILAKTTRDEEMIEADKLYPGYSFGQHKGYGTKLHYEALDKLGPSPIHRESFLKSWYKRRGE